jgi:hypothetical protein
MAERDEIDRVSERDERTASDTIRGQLIERDVRLNGDETPEQLAELLTAVEEFERAVAVLGGDSMTNAPDSARTPRASPQPPPDLAARPNDPGGYSFGSVTPT